MINLIVVILAYMIDRIFGEFHFIEHPVNKIKEMIDYFENKYYKDSVSRGLLLVLFVVGIVGFISIVIMSFLSELPLFIDVIVTSVLASVFIAHRMLIDSVKEILSTTNKKESDVYKAAIETYSENLSDGVVAPIFYLLLFGLPGIIIYKAVNTMDSIVGYRTPEYENYGKAAAILDDILNYIPSRITAVLIMILGRKKNIFAFYKDGKKHDSPNAGHPITAMALVLGVKLGGDTSYFGKIKEKAYFGKGKEVIEASDVQRAINLGSFLKSKKDYD